VSSNDDANQSDKENCVELVEPDDDADQVQVIRKRTKNLIMDSYCEEVPQVDIVQPKANNYVPITNPKSHFYQHSLVLIDEEEQVNGVHNKKKQEREEEEEDDLSEDELNRFLSEFDVRKGFDSNKTEEIRVDSSKETTKETGSKQENLSEIVIDDDDDGEDEEFNKWIVEDTFLEIIERDSTSSKANSSHQANKNPVKNEKPSICNKKENGTTESKDRPIELKQETVTVKPTVNNSINHSINREVSNKGAKTNSNVLIVDVSLLTSAAVSKAVSTRTTVLLK
jgi:hypothetical protein